MLQQLSSGSKINSGADDAAGLSLVDGLQANSMALSQSQTNATEGVGLLTVADGALSQVTNLLNRAVTLATEASNGTLNSSQDTAANQEYQSILSEINNIGSTTTYNQEAVFNSNTNIYTGDSSSVGASIDALNIRTLSSSNIGDTGGVMSYSNGQSSVFLNLSSSTQNAQSTDALNASGSSTINVNYLVKGANGAETAASTAITVGTGTSYANTASGLISAINSSGLGLTANFTTQSQAGVSGGGTETGIQISGGLISVGVDPSSSVTSGTLNPSEITNGDLTVGQTITVNAGSTTAASVTIGQTNDTLAGLAAAINAGTGGAGGVTATVVDNASGTPVSLKLADSSSTGGALTVTTTAATVVPNALTPGTTITSASNPSAVTFTAGATGAVGVQGTATLAISGTGSNSPSQALTGSITLANGSVSKTFTMGTGASNSVSGNTITLSGANSTLTGLASAISSYLGASATASSSGIAITSTATGTNITQTSSTLTAALAAGVTTNVAGLAASAGTDGSTVLSMTGDGMGLSTTTALTSGTHITLTNGSGTATTFTIGSSYAVSGGGASVTTGATTVQGLITAINANTATNGMSATLSNGTLVVSSTAVDTSIVASANNLAGTQSLSATSGSASPTSNVYSTVNVTVGTNNPADNSLTTTGDTLAGSMTITNGGVTDTFIMGAAGSSTSTTFYTGASTLASLESTINNAAANLGITATADDTAGGSNGTGLTLTANAYGTTISTGGTGIVDTSTVGTDAVSAIGTGTGETLTTTLSSDDGGQLSSSGSASVFSGSFVINETGTGVNGGAAASLTVDVGAAAGSNTSTNDTATTIYVPGSGTTATMAQVAAAINTFILSATNTGGKDFDVSASVDANTGGLTVQAGAHVATDSALSISGSTLTAAQTLTAGTVTAGSVLGSATDTVTNGTPSAISLTDVLTPGGTITIGNTAGSESTNGSHSVVFTIGASSATESGDGTDAVTTGGDTMQALVTAINNQTNMDLQASIVGGALQITSDAASNAGTLTLATSGLAQAYGVGNAVVTAGTGPTAATSAAVTINTTHGMSTNGSDALAGQLILTNSSNGTAVTFNLNDSAASSGNTVNITTANSTLNGLVSAINSNSTLGITASVNSSTGALQLQANSTDTSITVGGTGLTDATSETLTAGVAASPSAASTGTINLVTGSFVGGNTLTGGISVTANGSTTNYVMGGGATNSVSGSTVTLSAANSTVAGFEAALTAYQGLSTSVSGGALTLTSGSDNADAISISGNTLSDTLGYASSTASLGTFASESDAVSGHLNYSVGATNYAIGSVNGMTAGQLINEINYGNTAGTGTAGVNGVTASWVPSGNGSFGSIQLTSNTYGASGNITNEGIGTSINDLGTSASLTYTAGSAYNIGISNVAGAGVYDASTQTAPSGVSAAYTNLTSSAGGSGGIATIGYSDGAGESLSTTDLSNQTDAETALTALNTAITDVAAQDGYIGAQINTLNAVSQVLSTQQENVVSAQNAVQATDYASATSNMSKYEILSQTGISALAQANSMQQEVTKLLQ